MSVNKTCPTCGQGKFPFKKGICFVCGKQVPTICDIHYKQHLKHVPHLAYEEVDLIFSKLHQSDYEYADC